MKRFVTKSTVSSICSKVGTALLVICLAYILPRMQAQTLRPVTSAWTMEAGSAQNANTYLSPLKYSGWTVGVGLERWQAMRLNPRSWVMRLEVRAEMDRTLSPSRYSVMWGVDFSGAWSMMWRRANLVPDLTVGVGPCADLNVGALYLPKNGNNPVQAEASFTVGVTAYATYAFRLDRLPVVLRYQPTVPLLGAFFCPDYGELYYEISLGDYSNLVHFAWPGPYRRFKSLLTADLRFGATALRIGYRADVLSTKVNGIINRSISNMVTIGVSGEWMMLRPTKTLSHDAEIISAFY